MQWESRQDQDESGIGELRFLIVEDDEFQREWLLAMLHNLGARHIRQAADGNAALAILKDPAQRIDITLIDLKMPGMDGMELIRHMANDDHPSSVILASAMAPALIFSVQTMSKAYGVHLLGAIEKPATPELLMTLIAKHVRRIAEPVITPLPEFTGPEIRNALYRREFEPFFQPKVELASGKVTGVESFARWRHPDYGILAPAGFLPAVEKTGNMEALTWSMLEQAVEACSRWHRQGFPLKVSLNLPSSCLSQAGFADRIIEHVLRRAVDPWQLIFEISEATVTADAPIILENLARLRMKEFGLSVDDYSNAQAGMQDLLRVPFTELKFDRGFVVGAAQDSTVQIVLGLSLELCRKLKRESVAVGIENRQDWNLVLGMGCTHAQGNYIAKPMEGEALVVWMKEWQEFF